MQYIMTSIVTLILVFFISLKIGDTFKDFIATFIIGAVLSFIPIINTCILCIITIMVLFIGLIYVVENTAGFIVNKFNLGFLKKLYDRIHK